MSDSSSQTMRKGATIGGSNWRQKCGQVERGPRLAVNFSARQDPSPMNLAMFCHAKGALGDKCTSCLSVSKGKIREWVVQRDSNTQKSHA